MGSAAVFNSELLNELLLEPDPLKTIARVSISKASLHLAAKMLFTTAQLPEVEYTAAESVRSAPQVQDKYTGLLEHNRGKSRFASSSHLTSCMPVR